VTARSEGMSASCTVHIPASAKLEAVFDSLDFPNNNRPRLGKVEVGAFDGVWLENGQSCGNNERQLWSTTVITGERKTVF
jgi:hypothetical protein